MQIFERRSQSGFRFWRASRKPVVYRLPFLTLTALFSSVPLHAQSPWEQAVTALQTAFTGPIAKGLSLVAIVVGGLMFAFGEGGNKRMFAGIVFGIGMAIAAVNFLSWLFPGS